MPTTASLIYRRSLVEDAVPPYQDFDWLNWSYPEPMPVYQMNRPYPVGTLPLWGSTTGQIEFPLPVPLFGYLPLWSWDQEAYAPQLQSDMLVRLSVVKHIIYQEFWWLQHELIVNWAEFAAESVLNLFFNIAAAILELLTRGATIPIETLIDRIQEFMHLDNLRYSMEAATKQMMERLDRNVLPQHGADYNLMMLRRAQKFIRGA